MKTNPDLFQVILMSCHCRHLICFATHHWFVVNRKGTVSRWEVLLEKEKNCPTRWGHLYKNAHPPFKQFGFFTPEGTPLWEPVALGMIEGKEGSEAERMADFIEKSAETYPYCHKYFLWSPNSNTYVQWVLNHFPEFPAKLPWNAFGKNCNLTP